MFSPPNVAGEPYLARDGGAAVDATFLTRYDRTQTESATTARGDLLDTQETLHNDEACAPATQAPQAP